MADKQPRYPGYTALLPPAVRYDQELRPAAKLLYAEISAMADVTGFCWASNRYLGALLGLAKRTVTELLAQLEARGYIMIETLRNEKNEVTERRLYITDAGLKNGWANGFVPTHRIRVPFSYETAMSGIGDGAVHPVVWYQTTLETGDLRADETLLLHLDGCDVA